MRAALLPDRGVVKVTGDDAGKFLNGLVTADVGKVRPERALFAALLTPQGKIIVDFLLVEASAEDGGGYYLDCPCALAGRLVERLTFYKLRAKVGIEDLSDKLGVLAIWDGEGKTAYGLCYSDPRLAALGSRCLLPPQVAAAAAEDLGAALGDAGEYEAHRIALGVPCGGLDFTYGDAYPHETDMDQLAGVDFDKGCYVGQEVVSRVEHRGSARKRIVPVIFDDGAPMSGAPVTADDKEIGTMGSAALGRGLAMLRLDRVADALSAGTSLEAGGVPLRPLKPEWAKFEWPEARTTA
jgi:folate-binding protein YgfZ